MNLTTTLAENLVSALVKCADGNLKTGGKKPVYTG